MNEIKIPKRITTALINSLTAGVVPRIGLEHIAVGRKPEIEAILGDLDNIAEGGAAFKLITGRYGSGKSFLLQTIRNYAMDRGFVVADGDLSPERRLVGTKGQGLATYRELMMNLSTRTRPDGGALETILQKWIAVLQQSVMTELGLSPNDAALTVEVEQRIVAVTNEMQNMVHGFDFAKVLAAYWSGYKQMNDELKQAALRWLRGEYPTKTDARKELGVGVIIDDDNWYDYMKLWAEFVARIGYKGLLLFIDEGVNLYKITNSISRNSNYEKLLTMFNDTMQGKAEHLGIFMGGTPQFVEDERRGLFSYEALRSRLVAGRYAGAGLRNYTGPIIKLDMLSYEEILILLRRLRHVHGLHFGYEVSLTDSQLILFMEQAVGMLGADELLTTREIIRDFVDMMHTLHQHPDISFESLLGERLVKPAVSDPDEANDFLAEFEL
ncbi:ATP-binding protein [Paenibacillus sp. ACRRX]|uniref:ATP-binding protein n=1 Tax=unclassified Paenibacillus TaxID=185978 RepID=UPI001EF73381|nr:MULTISPECIES: ATP-binding protein [unclassified Paenibacillus]MCG7409647.1 ATP-binding protein [Paenibacillus sp. ACRRX]MDK8183276.1 ATP-binding protein [Paenibacillus sp. UMB4589-SE434]